MSTSRRDGIVVMGLGSEMSRWVTRIRGSLVGVEGVLLV